MLLVSTNVLANGRGRWLAIVASLVVAAAMIYAQDTKPRSYVQPPAATPTATPSATPKDPVAAPPGAPHIASQAEAEQLAALAATAPTTAQQFQFPLSPGVASEDRLQVKTIWAARVISVLFPEIKTIYGYRQDPLPWHPNGLAIDVMIPNPHTPEGIELGNQIAGYALANAKRWGINHVIWRQKIYPGVGAGSWTADYGSETANHYDHVHIATNGGGYPTGHETYYIASMTPTPPA
ncbi:glycoside hydrolase [Mycobacterium sp. IS-836]|uniref:glycoside hydrolase n=1 Tax=Mycobacterium sp. IS-836 TaxID=1834160 RepID=UPI00350EC722